MRIFKKLCAIVYALAAIVALGCLAGLLYPPAAARAEELLERLPVRIAVAVCAGIVALGVLITLVRTLTARREPDAVRPEGAPDVEITCAALASSARVAAEAEGVMVEEVSCRVVGVDRSQVHVHIDAIAFTDVGLAELAARIQRAVEAACERLMGATGVTARVRFLPSTTTIIQGGSS